MDWIMQHQYTLRGSLSTEKLLRERSGGKMIYFVTKKDSVREVSYILETYAS